MSQLRSYSIAIGLMIIILCTMHSTLFAKSWISQFDIERLHQNRKVLESSLQIVKKISLIKQPTAMEILHIYKAEQAISGCIWGEPSKTITTNQSFNCAADTKVRAEIILYVRTNQSRFKVVEDGFKGEYNFFEPNRYWLDRINESFPNSPESKEIEFDLDFNEFMREFDIYKKAKGQSCEQHIKQSFKEGWYTIYTKDFIKQWIPECEQARKDFRIGRKKLLEKFQNAPFTKKLQDIDETTIVIFHSEC
ncbi:MAG: hypothetical protein A2W27_08820 [Deltaproteobacteria bacterium RBG_16_44_11]|nr:MAG: hypothetical protein A2W27_08820 [Deltaproteobacteria bacterium RBG_16_44_11]